MTRAAAPSVLIVEEGEVGRRLAAFLAARGFAARVAHAGAQALIEVQADPPAVLLSDTLLPDMNGRDLVRQARALGPSRPACVLMSSVFTAVRERLDDADAEVVAFLPKPLQLDDVERTLRRVLGQAAPAEAPVEVAAPAAPASSPALPDACHAAQVLLEHLAQRRSGVLQFRHEKDEVDVTLLHGVPVNARSNLRQHTLGSYLVSVGRLSEVQVQAVDALMRERKLRFGEALAELGYASSSETVQFLRGAVLARIAHAVTWCPVQLSFVEDQGAAEGAALTEIDPREAILVGFARHTDIHQAVAAVGAQRDRYPCATPHLEALREVVSQVLAGSPLPAALQPVRRLDELLVSLQGQGARAVHDLYALWVAGLIEFCDRPPTVQEVRGTAGAVVLTAAPAAVASIEVAEAIFSEYLRCQGAGHYAVLGVDPAVGLSAIEAAGASLRARLDAWSEVPSAPLRARVEEMRGWLERALLVLRDPDQRVAYDRALLGMAQAAPAGLQDAEAEALFRQGLQAMQGQDLDAAFTALAQAVARCPADPDYAAALGWVETRRAVRDAAAGYERLVVVCAQNPSAAQAHYYLGLLSEERGHRDNAIDALARAVAVDPHHDDAAAALARLRGDERDLYRDLFGDAG